MQREVNIGLIKMKKRIVPFIRMKFFDSVAGGAGGGGVCLAYNKGLVANTACEIQALFWSCYDFVFVCLLA